MELSWKWNLNIVDAAHPTFGRKVKKTQIQHGGGCNIMNRKMSNVYFIIDLASENEHMMNFEIGIAK